jgi:DNA-binding LytR/AlgR family response regulator
MRARTIDLLAILGVFAAYTITIRFALHLDLVASLLAGGANTVPIVIFGVIVRRIVMQRLVTQPVPIQLAAHLGLCTAFAALSYLMLIVLLGFTNGRGPAGFLVEPFSASGLAWQSLENVTTYALIAAVSHLQAQNRMLAASAAGGGRPMSDAAVVDAREAGNQTSRPETTSLPIALPEGNEPRTDPSLSRYFVRIGEELRPLDIDTVVSIGGADDYSEVRTLSGKHLVRVTLTEFARSLDPARYVRVHRSWIVNVERISRAESAGGGRLLLHMETGQTLSTSRAGAKLLRDRIL